MTGRWPHNTQQSHSWVPYPKKQVISGSPRSPDGCATYPSRLADFQVLDSFLSQGQAVTRRDLEGERKEALSEQCYGRRCQLASHPAARKEAPCPLAGLCGQIGLTQARMPPCGAAEGTPTLNLYLGGGQDHRKDITGPSHFNPQRATGSFTRSVLSQLLMV